MRTLLLVTCAVLISISASSQGLHSRATHLPCIEKEFPVIVHLSVDSISNRPFLSNKDVEGLLNLTSAFFDPICMSFTACEINHIDVYTFNTVVDSNRLTEMRILFGKPRRLNIYIVGSIPEAYCGTSMLYGIDKEHGEYIYLEREDCFDSLQGQLAHHLGHFFGLSDTYAGNATSYVNDQNCEIVADSLCDTATDPFGFFQGSPGRYIDPQGDFLDPINFVKDCEFILEEKDPDGEYYQPDVSNIMSAYPCKCGFTNGQFLKIVENYSKSENKPY